MYSPISLINADAKLYSKIFAIRLGKIISRLVSPWQHGFIQGGGTTDHIRRVITLFDIAAISGEQMALILLNAQKAFDRVAWDCLWDILWQNGFRPRIITAIRAMYLHPFSRIQMMGRDSERFEVARGTRQGCPCSPILFALYIDPLIREILLNHKIKPVSVRGYDIKVLAYADDIAIVTPHPQNAIIQVESLAREFGRQAGYLLNTERTQIVYTQNITLQNPRRTEGATYLGIGITANVDLIWSRTWTP